MAKKQSKTIQQLIREQKNIIAELTDELRTQLYFETMPEYGPTYQYCFSTSNQKIPYQYQNIDNWIKAVIRHMGTRRTGHGGASTKAILVSIPFNLNEDNFENWLAYQMNNFRKKIKPRTRKKTL